MNWTTRLLADSNVWGDLSQTVLVGSDADGRIDRAFARQVYGAFQDERVMAVQGGVSWPGACCSIKTWRTWRKENFILGHPQQFRHRLGTCPPTGSAQAMRTSRFELP